MKAARATSDGGVLDAQRPVAADPPREKLRPGEPATLMRRTRGAIRHELWPVAGFSLAINVLALVSSIYLMELFDRVLTSGSYGTLLWLTVLAIGATAVFGLYRAVEVLTDAAPLAG
jgi:ABC-type protease/lipase transport system fused ATPase/permease subunit